jgi:hypothetical protein
MADLRTTIIEVRFSGLILNRLATATTEPNGDGVERQAPPQNEPQLQYAHHQTKY